MNAAFEYAFDELLVYEGGYVNDPDDPGGETKYGISKRQYPDTDIKNLTVEEAKEIYYTDYWHRIRLDEVEDGKIAGELFEQAVNFGHRAAVENAQRALKLLGSNVELDGYIGSQTIGALNRYRDKAALYKTLNGVQFVRYMKIVETHPHMGKYFRGWLRRMG